MTICRIEILLKSDTLIGSGESFGAIIDSDIVFDEIGLPLIPSKRIKGCLLHSAREIEAMVERSEIEFNIDIDSTFGKRGTSASAPVYFDNLTIEDYSENRQWLKYFMQRYDELLSSESVLDHFTTIRQQTAIDEDGVAKEHSLRTIRVIKKGTIFAANICIEADDPGKIVNTLALACRNLRHIGTKRNRGFGEIVCKLLDGEKEVVTDILQGVAS